MTLSAAAIKKLKKIVGPEHVLTAHEELLCYSYDGTGREHLPQAVVFPAGSQEVSEVMQLANATPFSVVPRGAGSGMTGGALAIAEGLVLVMSRMNRILDIDEINQTATVEPGVITGQLREAAKKQGLFYPPDPASYKFCTIGGNVAECAGGPSAVKYGVTRDYVLGLEAVLPDGRIIHTGVQTAKGVVGYDLTRLLIGSEGTLAVITKVIVRLLPQPQARSTMQVLCDSMAGGAQLVAKILAKHTPCTLEYMDSTALSIVADRLPTAMPKATKALLLIELDGTPEAVNEESRELSDFLEQQDGVLSVQLAADEEEAKGLWVARRTLSPASFDLKPDKIGEDVVVPRDKIPALVACTEQLKTKHDIIIFTFGHAGDGNIHVNTMVDKNDPAEEERAQAAKKELFAEVLRLGGTLSGEHGVGITKSDFITMEIDEPTLNLMRQVKQLFDPKNILNPGKIFPA